MVSLAAAYFLEIIHYRQHSQWNTPLFEYQFNKALLGK
ncbi:hypothetical protein VCA_000237 [Vibrio albensis VL426]|nr:hypothetical protein VCA_000237 [Vibrio cholerae VL426]